ncbi:cullin-1-like isoform X2 [Cicer arietinum]|uniref:Cullin-1-like isoform X2 n=1 Tax=Cicer arietinum TaxID=3827 RepID=A0A1S2YNY5_CICAR|nr:cullin-1-like isoform X2 [Cicer arietinum]
MTIKKFMSLKEGCDYLEKGITKLYDIVDGFPEPNFTPYHHIMLYTTVYNMCYRIPPYNYVPYNYAQQLLNKYKEACEKYIKSRVLPSLREKKDEVLLREVLRRWSIYKTMAKRLSHFFFSLQRKLSCSLQQFSFISFYHLVYQEMNKEIMDAMFSMIDRKLAGEQIDQNFVYNTFGFYLEFDEYTRKNKPEEKKMNPSPEALSKKIKLVSSDEDVFEVECSVALMSKKIEEIIETIPVGDDVNTIPIALSTKMLTMFIEYCEKHNSVPKYVDLKNWDAQFVDVDRETLFDLQTSAGYMRIDSLLKLAWDKIDSMIKDKTPEEIAQFYVS